ncbi:MULTISPECIES: hypothetical protein [unclassified Nonomuraea]|uniref:hypothetical protein n=1 Tax=unclassified Nonomuraea TaxID=2593643 RepID=UPI0033F744AA
MSTSGGLPGHGDLAGVIGYGTPAEHAFTAAPDALCLALPDPGESGVPSGTRR